jgi:hypothetical protein
VKVVIFDSEGINALSDPHSNKHSAALAHIESVSGKHRRSTGGVLLVPTTVRVESGWDRTAASAARLNRFGIDDVDLDPPAADVAARLRRDLRVSPADAHVGAVVARRPAVDEVTIVSSDTKDMSALAGGRARIARI